MQRHSTFLSLIAAALMSMAASHSKPLSPRADGPSLPAYVFLLAPADEKKVLSINSKEWEGVSNGVGTYQTSTNQQHWDEDAKAMRDFAQVGLVSLESVDPEEPSEWFSIFIQQDNEKYTRVSVSHIHVSSPCRVLIN